MSDTPEPAHDAADVDAMRALYRFFHDPASAIPKAEVITPEETPEPFRTLLAHENHMTVTLETFLGAPVNVEALEVISVGAVYARKSLLSDPRTDRVVQFGIMKFDFSKCDERTRERIEEARTPLGRILIEHGIMRRLGLRALLRITPDRMMRDYFEMADTAPVYGRLATIFCNGEPAVDLLEVVSPGLETYQSADGAISKE